MLTLAGQELLLARADLAEHLESYRPLVDLNFFGRLAWHERDTRGNSRSGFRAGRGVAIPNHSPEPRLAINTLYWPTGASRFARGFFLADSQRIPKILEAAGATAATAVPLTLADPNSGQSITTSVYLLPLRPLADVPGANGLYLLPVVDERYWWQYKNAGDLAITTASTWDDLFVELASALGINLDILVASTAAAAYVQPDPLEFSRPYENAAVLLDALAAALGMHVARNWLTGALIIQHGRDAAISLDLATAAALTHPYRIAGHEETASAAHAFAVPASVDVVFPRYCGGRPQCDGAVHTINKPAPAAAGPAGSAKTFHTTAWADFASLIDSTPANSSALDDLATEIAKDYYAWAGRRYDLSFAGFYPWPANPFDDWIIWRYGTTDPDGEPTIATTRVLSRPLNYGVEELAHQFADWPDLPEEVRFVLTENLSAGGSAIARIQVWDPNSEDWVDTVWTIRVHDYIGSMVGREGDTGVARHWCDHCAWEILQLHC